MTAITAESTPQQPTMRPPRPTVGMALAFKTTAAASVAGIPATVIDSWPRVGAGNCLVTLEYAAPVRQCHGLIHRIDAFLSELDFPADRSDLGGGTGTGHGVPVGRHTGRVSGMGYRPSRAGWCLRQRHRYSLPGRSPQARPIMCERMCV